MPISIKELAAGLGLSARRLQQFTDQGMPKVKHGEYDPLDVCRWFYLKWRDAELKKEKEDSRSDEEDRRHKRIKADREELKLNQERGDLMPTGIIQPIGKDIFAIFRVNVMNAAARLAPSLEMVAALEAQRRVENALLSLLRDMANSFAREMAKTLGADADIIGADGARPDSPARPGAHVSGVGPGTGTSAVTHHKRVGESVSNSAKGNKRKARPIRS